MLKTVVIVSLLFCINLGLAGQVQIQSTVPTIGLVQKNQLWNVVLMNGTPEAMTGRLELVLFDRQSSQELMTAVSNDFLLIKGAMVVNVNTVGPISYNYIGITPDRNINGLLPVGAYTVCYSFVRDPNSSKREMLAEECVAFDVEPLSPPMLSYPGDSSILETAPTQFSWTPPLPVAMLSGLQYTFFISEVMPLQKPTEAVQENMAFFSNDQVPNNFMTYPASLPAFEKDRWYAWQVIARDGSNYAGKSEVWVFKIAKQDSVQPILNGTPYVQLQKGGAEKTVAANGIIRFYYFNQLADTAVTVTISDLTAETKGESARFILRLARGQNYLQKDVSKHMKMQEGHLYMLTMHNSAMEKWNIMFEIKKVQK